MSIVHESAFIHPQAAVIGNVTIGKDVYIALEAAICGDWWGDCYRPNPLLKRMVQNGETFYE